MKKQLLIVEGKEDGIVIGTLVKYKGLFVVEFPQKHEKKGNLPVIQGKNFEGVSTLLEELEDFLKTNLKAGYTDIAIVLDADTNLQSQWEAVRNRLLKLDFDVPKMPNTEGVLAFHKYDDTVKIGVWLMPDNRLNGMLEDFVKMLVPDNDLMLEKATTIVKEIKVEIDEMHRFKDAHLAKAEIHTWLAWQENPGSPMGQAITKKYLNTDNEVCERFLTWLKAVFLT
jgi:hypothetical protein